MSERRRFLNELREINRGLYGDVSLRAAAQRGGRSPFAFHRVFRRLAGETLKQYTLRVRLERAAVELLATDKAVAAVASSKGFSNHEVFTRAFHCRSWGFPLARYPVAGPLTTVEAGVPLKAPAKPEVEFPTGNGT
jgi:AraC family transcriptional regulator